MTPEEAAKKLRNARLAKGLTIEKLGDLCHLQASFISSIERNRSKTPPGEWALCRLAEKLDLGDGLDLMAAYRVMPNKIYEEFKSRPGLIYALIDAVASNLNDDELDILQESIRSGDIYLFLNDHKSLRKRETGVGE